MRLSSLLACAAVLACATLVAADAPHARAHRHVHRHAGEQPLQRSKPAAPLVEGATDGMKLDWRASVYQGVDRATQVDANMPTQVKLAFIPVSFALPPVAATRSSDKLSRLSSHTHLSCHLLFCVVCSMCVV